MASSVLEFSPSSRAPLVFRPSLHTIDEIVNALAPFYGPNCPISAVFNDNSPKESRVDATLSTVVGVLRNYVGSREPVLVIG
jgi:precorrin-4 methylase